VAFGRRYHAHDLARWLKALGGTPQQPVMNAWNGMTLCCVPGLHVTGTNPQKTWGQGEAKVFGDATTCVPLRHPPLIDAPKRPELSVVVRLSSLGRVYKRQVRSTTIGDGLGTAYALSSTRSPAPYSAHKQ
jgi:hypothetical protein